LTHFKRAIYHEQRKIAAMVMVLKNEDMEGLLPMAEEVDAIEAASGNWARVRR
jgi:hypothetical protein